MTFSPVRYRLDEAVAAVRSRTSLTPSAAVVLGSGLGPYADTLAGSTAIPYADVPHMPGVSVVGHAGRFVLGSVGGAASPSTIVALSGRVHLYEGHSPEDVVFGVRLAIALGARIVVLTNAAGAIHPALNPGDLALITDHLNFQGRNPLVGANDERLGPRFPDMSTVYDPDLRAHATEVAGRLGIQLHSGIYAAMLGPSYETPAEIRMLRTVGADLVGMSTVLEATAARHMGARVLGISCVTNLAAGVSPTPLSHAEVEVTARKARTRFASLLDALLGSLESLPG